MFTGCGTAMVTPFRADGSLDEPTLRNLILRQIDAGINFLVPCGTTGESPTLTHEEHLRVVEITVGSRRKVPVLPARAAITPRSDCASRGNLRRSALTDFR
jgi:4-hydroxy-tetrahydrodipicolinate synthase